MKRCRGRPKCPRRVEIIPSVTYFKPRGIPLENLKVMELSVVELEALRLVELLGLEQDAAATKMGISRRAFWNELTNARMKVTKALVNGYAIKIKGGEYTMEKRKFVCLKCENEWSIPFGGGRSEKCPKCGYKNFHRHLESRGPASSIAEFGRKCMHGHGFGRRRCCGGSAKIKKKMPSDEEE